VRPFRALRYSPDIDLAKAVCPPFDVISPEEQRVLHGRSPYNAVHVELAENVGGSRYERAALTLRKWLEGGILMRDPSPAFYVYQQQFEYHGRSYTRIKLFARLRLEPWSTGTVLPHEQTFGAPKEDRLKLLRATRLNSSPVFLIYRDRKSEIQSILNAATAHPVAEFQDYDGQKHALQRLDEPRAATALRDAFKGETLYIADGHHRYETALAYREERKAAVSLWTGEEPENFVLVALTAAGDPGLLVLPIHRLTAAPAPLEDTFRRLVRIFDIETQAGDVQALAESVRQRGRLLPTFGLVSAESPDLYLLSLSDPAAADALMPAGRSPAWRRMDYAIANHVIIQHGMGVTESQMSDYSVVWFSEDAAEAARQVREGRARYAVLVNPVPLKKLLDLADAGERMPQKSTFFYPKVPTGIVFNLLAD
jgi:uncharacterized protein (DUF1015 family)